MKRILLIIDLILQAFFIFSHSAPAVTLEECKTLALQNSKLLAAYENLIQAAISANRKDKSALLPQISGFYQPDYVQYGDKVDFPRHGARTHLGVGFSLDIPKILADYPQLSNLEIEKSKAQAVNIKEEAKIEAEKIKEGVLEKSKEEAKRFIDETAKDAKRKNNETNKPHFYRT